MSYPIKNCILDLLAASGPQTFEELKSECKIQVVGEIVTDFNVRRVVLKMVKAGLVYTDPNIVYFAGSAEELQ